MSQRECSITEFAPAKVNLALHVVGRRLDGYHLLESLVFFADVGDIVSFEPGHADFTFRVSFSEGFGQQDEVPLDQRNLAVKAERLASSKGLSTRGALHLQKQLPAGAGLGGGTGDATAALHCFERAGKCEELFSVDELLQIGADAPVCYLKQGAFVSGIGEVLHPLPVEVSIPAVLIWPGQGVSTVEAFKSRQGAFDPPIDFDVLIDGLRLDPVLAISELVNGLEASAMALCPAIEKALEALTQQKTCRFARMTGSGSAVFGLFDDLEVASEVAGVLARQHPAWWVRATRLSTNPPGLPPSDH